MTLSLRGKVVLGRAARSYTGRHGRMAIPCPVRVLDGRYSIEIFAKNTTPSSRAYSVAIARDLPSTFADALTKYSDDDSPVNVAVAQEQHAQYLEKLRDLVPTYSLPALEEHPDSVFVEDTVVAIGKTAVITNPGHPSRRGEVGTVKEALQRYGMEVLDMTDKDLNEHSLGVPMCDGGDVLHTSRHLFVGLSERTNLEAYHLLKQVFKMVETIPIPLDKIPDFPVLHLKSMISHMDFFTLVAPEGPHADQLLEMMNIEMLGYDVVRVPNPLAANLISVNGRILAQDGGCSQSRDILTQAAEVRGHKIEFVDCSELAKVDAALTCCSVLLMGK